MIDEINPNNPTAMLQKITADVFQSVIGIDVEEAASDDANLALDLSATVRFEDGDHGAVVMEVSSALAQKLSSILLCLDDSETDDTLIHDAIGEIVNIIAGNYKAACGSSSRLSMPHVTPDANARQQYPPEQRNALLCEEEQFLVAGWLKQ